MTLILKGITADVRTFSEECVEQAQGGNANGVTMDMDDGRCWAEFGMHSINKDSDKYITGFFN